MKNIHRSAVFSDCGRFRHIIRVGWDVSRPNIAWCCANPSQAGREVAGAVISDQSATKMVGFSDRLGYGSYSLVNGFDFIATDPKELKRAGYPRSDEADEWIARAVKESPDRRVICGWGQIYRRLARADEVLKLIRRHGGKPMALAFTDRGEPRHPLMLSYDCTLTEIPK
jgi:hypothetical protein